MRTLLLIPLISAAIFADAADAADTAEGDRAFSIGAAYTAVTFDSYLDGTTEVDLPSSTDQKLFDVSARWTQNERLTWHLKGGYGSVSGGGLEGDQGLLDTLISLAYSWTPTDEFGNAYTRGGIIIQGTYEVLGPQTLGESANGIEGAVGYSGTWDSGVAADIEGGLRIKGEGVPAALFGFARATWTWKMLTPSLGFRYDGSLSGEDFSDATNPQNVKRVAGFVEAGLGVALPNGWSTGAYYAKAVMGRNKGEKTAFGLYGTYRF